MSDGTEYFHIDGRYLDFDGKVFGEVPIETGILKFPGSRPVDSLDIFPLACHQNEEKIKAELIACGRKFHALIGVCHRQYDGIAFQMKQGKPVLISVKGRIVVDAAFFRQVNPNYTRPSIISARKKRSIDIWDLMEDASSSEGKTKRVNRGELKEGDFLLCRPTVLGFSLDDKLWRKSPLLSIVVSMSLIILFVVEFAVADIADISWNHSLLDYLAIKPERKKLIQALTTSHTSQTSDHSFDDFVAGRDADGRSTVGASSETALHSIFFFRTAAICADSSRYPPAI
jgi:hypothetical protein